MEKLNPISILVRNERGVLARVAGLFSRRGFNILSLAVGETDDPAISRISVVVRGDEATLQQAVKQLNRVVSVISVGDLSKDDRVERGLALIKVKAPPLTRHEVLEIAGIFRARVDHVDGQSVIIEVTGSRDKVQALINLLRPHGIIEMARTGQIALSRKGDITAEAGEKTEKEIKLAGSGPDENGIYNLKRGN